MSGKRATKHCYWGTCKSDSRYPEKMPAGTTFIRFPKPESIHENMTHWEKEQAKLKMEKHWQYLCGHKDFNNLRQITKDTYICSLHFVDNKGPTDENPEPILAIKSRQKLQTKSTKAENARISLE